MRRHKLNIIAKFPFLGVRQIL